MKTSRIITLIISVLAVSVGLSAKDFEGKIRLKMTVENGKEMFMNYFLKDGFARIEFEAGKGGAYITLFDPAKPGEIITLMPDQKMYMVTKLFDPKKVEQAAAQAQPEYVRTGETEKILGYRCEKVVVTMKDIATEAWGAEGLGTFMAMGKGGATNSSAPKSSWETALAEHGFFPLRSVSRNKAGKEITRLEAQSVESQSLDASFFAVPADYKKFEMPSFPGLKGLNPFGKKEN
jgi:hypothetical protein